MAAKAGTAGGAGGNAGGKVARAGYHYVTASSGRQTAFLLIVAILLARLILTHQLQDFWGAIWGQSRPLGTALPAKVAASQNASASSKGTK